MKIFLLTAEKNPFVSLKENKDNIITVGPEDRQPGWFKLVCKLRKYKFYSAFLPVLPSRYEFPQFYRKAIWTAYLAGAKKVVLFDLETGESNFLRRSELFKLLVLPELFLISLAIVFLPATALLLVTFALRLFFGPPKMKVRAN